MASANLIPIKYGALGAEASLDEYISILDIEKREVDGAQLSSLLGNA